jgi:acetyl esterase/lipase
MNGATLLNIMLLHGGGFNGGLPASVAPIASDLRGAGYNVIAVPYRDENPTGNILGEIATVRRYARDAGRNGPVVAYGVSAGGTLAAALAARGDVAGAVVAGGPTNLLTWICLSPLTTPSYWKSLGMSTADRRAASPFFRLDGHQSPQLLLYGDVDLLVPIDQGITYFHAARLRQADTKFTLMPVSPHMFRAPYVDEAREWIQQRWPVGRAVRVKPGRLVHRRS